MTVRKEVMIRDQSTGRVEASWTVDVDDPGALVEGVGLEVARQMAGAPPARPPLPDDARRVLFRELERGCSLSTALASTRAETGHTAAELFGMPSHPASVQDLWERLLLENEAGGLDRFLREQSEITLNDRGCHEFRVNGIRIVPKEYSMIYMGLDTESLIGFDGSCAYEVNWIVTRMLAEACEKEEVE